MSSPGPQVLLVSLRTTPHLPTLSQFYFKFNKYCIYCCSQNTHINDSGYSGYENKCKTIWCLLILFFNMGQPRPLLFIFLISSFYMWLTTHKLESNCTFLYLTKFASSPGASRQQEGVLGRCALMSDWFFSQWECHWCSKFTTQCLLCYVYSYFVA